MLEAQGKKKIMERPLFPLYGAVFPGVVDVTSPCKVRLCSENLQSATRGITRGGYRSRVSVLSANAEILSLWQSGVCTVFGRGRARDARDSGSRRSLEVEAGRDRWNGSWGTRLRNLGGAGAKGNSKGSKEMADTRQQRQHAAAKAEVQDAEMQDRDADTATV